MSSAKEVFTTWRKAINDRDWNSTASHFAPDATYNDRPAETLEEELKATWEAAPDLQSEIDTIVVDEERKAIAARIIHQGTLNKKIHDIEMTGEPIQWSEQIMLWTSSSKITRILSLIDTQHQVSPKVPRTPTDLVQRPPPSPLNLETMYRAYLDVVNGSSIRENLPRFYNSPLFHTGNARTIEYLADFVETSPTLFEGLILSVDEILVDNEGQQVGVRILFEGVPIKPFFGMGPPPEKKTVKFFEHAIYKLDAGKFKFIWAMLDLVSYKQQVEA